MSQLINYIPKVGDQLMKVIIQGSPKEIYKLAKQITVHPNSNVSEIAKLVKRQIAQAEIRALEKIREDYKLKEGE